MKQTSADFAVMRALGELVRAARDARKLTQEQVAERAGLDRTTLGKIERGIGNPTLVTINKLATVLREQFNDLFPCRAGH